MYIEDVHTQTMSVSKVEALSSTDKVVYKTFSCDIESRVTPPNGHYLGVPRNICPMINHTGPAFAGGMLRMWESALP